MLEQKRIPLKQWLSKLTLVKGQLLERHLLLAQEMGEIDRDLKLVNAISTIKGQFELPAPKAKSQASTPVAPKTRNKTPISKSVFQAMKANPGILSAQVREKVRLNGRSPQSVNTALHALVSSGKVVKRGKHGSYKYTVSK